MKNQPLVIGIAAAVITIAIGVGLVLAVTAGDDRASGTAGTDEPRSQPSSSSTRSSTTTTSEPGGGEKAPGPSAGQSAPTTTTTEPPDPPHPLDKYNPVPLPAGVSATLATCGWSPANGGMLQASGTITNLLPDDEFWGVSVYWLVWNQTQNEDIADQYEIYDLLPSQTLPWNLSISYPVPPPNLSCGLEVD